MDSGGHVSILRGRQRGQEVVTLIPGVMKDAKSSETERSCCLLAYLTDSECSQVTAFLVAPVRFCRRKVHDESAEWVECSNADNHRERRRLNLILLVFRGVIEMFITPGRIDRTGPCGRRVISRASVRRDYCNCTPGQNAWQSSWSDR